MNGRVKVGARSDFLPGEYRMAWDGDTPIAVYNLEGALYAVEGVAPTTTASWPVAKCSASKWSARATAIASTCSPAP